MNRGDGYLLFDGDLLQSNKFAEVEHTLELLASSWKPNNLLSMNFDQYGGPYQDSSYSSSQNQNTKSNIVNNTGSMPVNYPNYPNYPIRRLAEKGDANSEYTHQQPTHMFNDAQRISEILEDFPNQGYTHDTTWSNYGTSCPTSSTPGESSHSHTDFLESRRTSTSFNRIDPYTPDPSLAPSYNSFTVPQAPPPDRSFLYMMDPNLGPPRTTLQESPEHPLSNNLYNTGSYSSLGSMSYPSTGPNTSWKPGFDSVPSHPPEFSRSNSFSYLSDRRASTATTRTSYSSTGTQVKPATSSMPPYPSGKHRTRSGRASTDSNSATDEEPVICNDNVVNEYSWLSLGELTAGMRVEILKLAEEKKIMSPKNFLLPDTVSVSSILDVFSQKHVLLKLAILDHIYGEPLVGQPVDDDGIGTIPKMTFRETSDGVEILIQTSNGLDYPVPEITNEHLTGLRNARALRNQLCRTTRDVHMSAEKRPHNSWFLYRGAQMNRGSILMMTACLPDDLPTLQRIEESVIHGTGTMSKEECIAELRSKLVDPFDVRVDLTAIGYVVAYMWALESDHVKQQLTAISRIEHAHKLKVFPNYKYAPSRKAGGKRGSNASAGN